MSESIRVLVRIRPLSTSEKQRGCKSITAVDQENNQINLTSPNQNDNVKSFAYDAVFGQQSEQAQVYSKAAYSLVEHVIQGYNGTVFAYGQTGCGKTHSMVGRPESNELQGIMPRCFGHVLKTISQTSQKQFLLRCSFLQIYNEQIHDLLGDPKAKLQLKESPEKGVFVKDLVLKEALDHKQLMDYLNEGAKNRAVGQTAMNKDSSRSHLMLALHLESSTGQGEEKKYVGSRLNLVDLAGSQRLSKTGATGSRMKEGQKINLSLSALGNVISALVQGRSLHIPYRDSKLTRLLQDSLGGNTKTVMLANCSPADYNFQQTLSTLRYASRAKLIKNKPIINEDPKDALLKQYANEIQKLKSQLQSQGFQDAIPENPSLHNKLKEKQAQLEVQKNEKVSLMKKIQQLQSRHIEAKNVHVQQSIVKNLNRASVLLGDFNKKRVQPKCSIEQPIKLAKNASQKAKKEEAQGIISKDLKGDPTATKGFRNKIVQLQKQIRDISHESYLQKEFILDDVRGLTKENKFLESVLDLLLQNHQLQAIRQASVYNEQKQQYKVPPFYFKNKELIFPKLQQQQSIDMIKQMQQGRFLLIDGNKQNEEASRANSRARENTSALFLQNKGKINNNSGNSNNKKPSEYFILNDIVKQAKRGQIFHSITEQKKVRKVMLEPLMKL